MRRKVNDITDRTLAKRHKTTKTGVFYKEIERTVIDVSGNIKKKILDDKVYVIRYTDENKKEQYVTMGKYSEGIRENYCVNKRAEFITIAKNGELPPQLQRRENKEVVTLNKLADVYFFEKPITISSKKQLGKYNLYLNDRFGDKNLEQLAKQDFKKFQKDLKDEGKANRTINGIMSLGKAIINYSIKEHDLKLHNPIDGVKDFDVKSIRRERFLNLDEVLDLIKTVRTSKDIELYHFVRLALTTGGRIETIRDIAKKDIDFIHGTIILHDFKNESTYTGFIDPTYLKELQTFLKHYGVKDKIITMPLRTLQRKLKKILDELFNEGLDSRDFRDRVVVHTLRHTFASQLAIKGVPIYTIQQLMNHSDIKMTERYAKLSPNVGANAVKGLFNV